jgi:lipopolysaccharide export system ATP-binding protein
MTVGITQPDTGKILLDGNDITRLPMYLRARRGIGYLAQEPSVFRKLTALENILLVLELAKYPANKRVKRGPRTARRTGHRACRANPRVRGVGRGAAADRDCSCPGDGPGVYPYGRTVRDIDPKTVEDIQEIIRALTRRNIGILITDHNERATLGICDRVYILTDGQVVTSGTAQEIANDPVARKFYLGENFSL